MKNFEVYEDNAGMLHMVIFEGGKAVQVINGWEFGAENVLRDAVNELANNPYAYEDWDPSDTTNPAEFDSDGMELIADDNGIYPDDMGFAGRKAFGIED